ncbi:cell division protein ZipA [Pseudohalioglobus lutimaris]|uniref:Cell division protein ZipA n=1 Tax=Pseudohalioglobus lutimaris TaxID=1737061 RepID=A0A2N5WYR0_9GAMM|nr:cell division protein ZipA [Pseudohalioglobus lutimaris]PLW67360.1 cell division protein ZipA [Pseudohalioglobus lutimaris]
MSELTIRDWMVIIGVLLITAVLLDAWRRVRSDKYSRIKVKLADQEESVSPAEVEDISWLKELPNGGARVVQRGDLLKAAGHDVPDAVAEPASVDAPSVADQADAAGDEEREPAMASFSAEDDNTENLDWLDGMGADRTLPEQPDPAAPGVLPRDIDPEVFMLNVVARDPRGFKGEDILHILLACDLRFGDMNFFHRHEFEAGKGAIQFSVANMMQPGVFDIDNMSGVTTPGLVFFLTLPGPEDMMKAFDYMLETAQAVSRNLGGDVLDESRSVLTKQTLDHSRQQIRDLERRLLART